MKINILSKMSKELSDHIDNEFTRLNQEREKEHDFDKIINFYVEHKKIDLSLIESRQTTRKVVEVKREIAFIVYFISCPFWRAYGINEVLKKETREYLFKKLNIKTRSLSDHILSGKHHYRFYKEFKMIIDFIFSAHH